MKQYFDYFANLPELSVVEGSYRNHVQLFHAHTDCPTAIASGYYTFRFRNSDGTFKVVPARFTFTYRLSRRFVFCHLKDSRSRSSAVQQATAYDAMTAAAMAAIPDKQEGGVAAMRMWTITHHHSSGMPKQPPMLSRIDHGDRID